MTLYAMKHNNCPTCTCTKPINVGTKGHIDHGNPLLNKITLLEQQIESLTKRNKELEDAFKSMARLSRSNDR